MSAYNVTGTVTPDCTTPIVGGTGEPAGTFLSQPFWRWENAGKVWTLIYNGAAYIIRNAPGADNAIWTNQTAGTSPVGTYAPSGGIATGNPVVAAVSTYATLKVNDGPFAGQYVVLKME
jgi:hypothetical protein